MEAQITHSGNKEPVVPKSTFPEQLH